MKRNGLIGVFVVAALALFWSGAEQASAQTKLNMVGSWPPGVSSAADVGIRYMEEVNRRANGKVVINFKGAREVVPTFDQPEALVRGVFDVWYGALNYWAGVVKPGYVTELSPMEPPDGGPGNALHDFMVKMYEKKGVRYLGAFSGDRNTGNHFMSTQKNVSSPADLKGMKIRVPPLTRFFVKAVGAEPVTLPPSEVYLALERGTVEGFTWPYYDGFTNFGWHKVTKFLIGHPLYRDGIGIAVNLKKVEQPVQGRSAGHAGFRRSGPALVRRMDVRAPGLPVGGHEEGRHEGHQVLGRRGEELGQDFQRGPVGALQDRDERGRLRRGQEADGIQLTNHTPA